MGVSVELVPDQEESYSGIGRYGRSVGKLNYLIVTRFDIAFAVSVISQFLNSLLRPLK